MLELNVVRSFALYGLLVLSACGTGPSHGAVGAAEDSGDRWDGADAAPTDASGAEATLESGPDAGPFPVDAGPDAAPPPACVDVDGDGYGLNCALGEDCNDGDETVHPGADDADFDSLDADCDEKLGLHFAKVSEREPSAGVGRAVVLDDRVLLQVGSYLRAFRLPDLQTPIYDAPFLSGDLRVVQFREGTLAVSRGGDGELVLYDMSDAELGPVERGRIPTPAYPTVHLTADGKRVLVLRRGDNLLLSIELWNIEDLSVPKQVGTVDVECWSAGVDAPGDWLVVHDCQADQFSNANPALSIYDISDPSAPTRLAHASQSKYEYYLGTRDEKLYFGFGSQVTRRGLSNQNTNGLADPERVSVPTENSHEATQWGFDSAGPWYRERPVDNSDSMLCGFDSTFGASTCFPGALRDDELRAVLFLLADGPDLVLVGMEYLRHVDVSDPAAPVAGERRVSAGVRPVFVDDKKVVAVTLTGVATLDAESLTLLDFAPLHREDVRTAIADGDNAYVFDHDGQLGVFDITQSGQLSLVQRTFFASDAFTALLTRSADVPYLVAATGHSVMWGSLKPDGKFWGQGASVDFQSVIDIADNGQDLFASVTDSQGTRSVQKFSITDSSHEDLAVGIAGGPPLVMLAATEKDLYVAMNKVTDVDLASSELALLTSPSDVASFCQAGGRVITRHYDGTLGVIQGHDVKPLPIKGWTENLGMPECVGSENFLMLQWPGRLVSVKITEQ